MDDRVRAYIEKKRKEQHIATEQSTNRDKNFNLIKWGLYDKVFAPDEKQSSEYPYSSWDKEKKKDVYYKMVPFEVTDEEYAELLALHKNEADKTKNKDNGVEKALRYIGIICLVVSIIGGLGYGVQEEEFKWFLIIMLSFVSSGIISWALFTGFAEVIRLLEEIKNK